MKGRGGGQEEGYLPGFLGLLDQLEGSLVVSRQCFGSLQWERLGERMCSVLVGGGWGFGKS